jgi:hypothetical protein
VDDGAHLGAGSVWPKFLCRALKQENLFVRKVPPCFQICLDWSESYLFKVVSKYTKNLLTVLHAIASALHLFKHIEIINKFID